MSGQIFNFHDLGVGIGRHQVGGDQGCCQTSHTEQGSPTMKSYLVPNVNNSIAEALLPVLVFTLIKYHFTVNLWFLS